MHHTEHTDDHDDHQANRESKCILLNQRLEVYIKAGEQCCGNNHEEEEHEESRFHNLFFCFGCNVYCQFCATPENLEIALKSKFRDESGL